jgi:hypothetical protein
VCIVLIVAVGDVASDQEELFAASNKRDGNYELNERSNVRKEYETGAAFASVGCSFFLTTDQLFLSFSLHSSTISFLLYTNIV